MYFLQKVLSTARPKEDEICKTDYENKKFRKWMSVRREERGWLKRDYLSLFPKVYRAACKTIRVHACVCVGMCGVLRVPPLRPMCVCPSSRQACPAAPAKNPGILSAAVMSYYSIRLYGGEGDRGERWEVQFLPFLRLMAFSAGEVREDTRHPFIKNCKKVNVKFVLKLN